MTLSCLKSPLLCALYINLLHLTTHLFLYALFCVFPVCYDVRLSHLNKDYLIYCVSISPFVTSVCVFCVKMAEHTASLTFNSLINLVF